MPKRPTSDEINRLGVLTHNHSALLNAEMDKLEPLIMTGASKSLVDTHMLVIEDCFFRMIHLQRKHGELCKAFNDRSPEERR